MRIAFVGKGGSGKTTMTALFAQSVSRRCPVLAVDADLNIHLGPLLGINNPSAPEKYISHPLAAQKIKAHLKGENHRIKELAHFRKTTPPTAQSNFVFVSDQQNPILVEFGSQNGQIILLSVGGYESEEIGTGCYHNNLAVLENILSHLIDKDGVVVVDMVAGIDAFANTLHAQFDMLVLVVEPTRRGLEVFNQYKKLAQEAGVYDFLFVVGNKVKIDADKEFLKNRIPREKLMGFFEDSEYLRKKDQEGGKLETAGLTRSQLVLLEKIEQQLFSKPPEHQTRLQKLFELHRKYVRQDSIQERFGDLTDQIDSDFNLERFIEQYEDRTKKS